MRRLVTGKQMKEIDAYAIQTIGILSMVLMERAALAVADELMQEYQRRGRKPVWTPVSSYFAGRATMARTARRLPVYYI